MSTAGILMKPIRRPDGLPVRDHLGEGRLVLERPGEPLDPMGRRRAVREPALQLGHRGLDGREPLLDGCTCRHRSPLHPGRHWPAARGPTMPTVTGRMPFILSTN